VRGGCSGYPQDAFTSKGAGDGQEEAGALNMQLQPAARQETWGSCRARRLGAPPLPQVRQLGGRCGQIADQRRVRVRMCMCLNEKRLPAGGRCLSALRLRRDRLPLLGPTDCDCTETGGRSGGRWAHAAFCTPLRGTAYGVGGWVLEGWGWGVAGGIYRK
jgi:hypothetical protein